MDSGMTVHEKWWLGMLGPIVSGRPHQIGAYAKHLDRTHVTLKEAPGSAVPRPKTC